MPSFSGRVRRLLAGVGCLAVPALIALGPSQAAFADTSSGSTTPVTTTVNTVTSTVSSGLGLSSATKTLTSTKTASGSTAKTASSTTSSATNPPATGCAAAIAAGGLCVYTQGATVTADPTNGAWVSLCNLQINGSGLDYSYV